MKLAALTAALVAALAVAALPLLTTSNYIIGIGVSALIFTVAAAALSLIYGYTGLLSFAQLGFWGIGEMPWARTSGSFCLMATRVRPMRELQSAWRKASIATAKAQAIQ